MNSSYHVGDKVIQHGNNNVGIIKNQGSSGPQNMEKQPPRRGLGILAGVATMVSQVVAPVIEAVRNVTKAFGK